MPLVVCFSLLCLIAASAQNIPTDSAGKLLPAKLGEFRAVGLVGPAAQDSVPAADGNIFSSGARRSYTADDGSTLSVNLLTTATDSGAFSLLSQARREAENFREGRTSEAGVGTSGFSLWDGKFNKLTFFKGRAFAAVSEEEGKSIGAQRLTEFATSLAETLDRGEGDIPVLVKHLPDWQQAKQRAVYAVSIETLKQQFSDQGVLSVVDFGGGAEAVAAKYGDAELVIVEFNTPQLATDNDRRITAKLAELRGQGQPVPTAYRRVGNYSVFVFDAPSQEAANQLIEQVKYEQMVQWLGENPYRYERALREFSQTTLGVFVNVVKGSGLALISCLLVGGLFGGLLFIRRRAEQRESEAFADAGAMLRLNLDDLTPEIDPGRLLGRGK